MGYKDKNKQREYQRRWMKSRRLDYLADKSCHLCGESNSEILEIHHKDPSQKSTHRIWSWSQARREEELAKCVVLCGSCHKKQHATSHGKEWMYNHYKCRCDICRTEYSRIQRERKERNQNKI